MVLCVYVGCQAPTTYDFREFDHPMNFLYLQFNCTHFPHDYLLITFLGTDLGVQKYAVEY